MQGKIIKLRNDIGYGIIAADNGKRYRFARTEITNPRHARIGENVDFVLNARSPSKIIVLAGCPWTAFGDA